MVTIGQANVLSNGTTRVELLAGVANVRRATEQIIIYNGDAGSQSVTLERYDGTNYTTVAKLTLATGARATADKVFHTALSGTSGYTYIPDVTLKICLASANDKLYAKLAAGTSTSVQFTVGYTDYE